MKQIINESVRKHQLSLTQHVLYRTVCVWQKGVCLLLTLHLTLPKIPSCFPGNVLTLLLHLLFLTLAALTIIPSYKHTCMHAHTHGPAFLTGHQVNNNNLTESLFPQKCPTSASQLCEFSCAPTNHHFSWNSSRRFYTSTASRRCDFSCAPTEYIL